MQIAVVVEKGEIGKGAPGIKCELGHCFLEATVLQAAYAVRLVRIEPWKSDAKIRLYRLKVRRCGQAPANTTAVCRHRLCLWRGFGRPFQASTGVPERTLRCPDSLGCLRISFSTTSRRTDRTASAGSDSGRWSEMQSETVASITGRTRRLISAPAKLEALGGDGSRKDRRTKAVHDGRAERRNRLDFGDDIGRDPRPGQGFVDQAAQEVAPARQQERHIGKRRKRQCFSRRLLELPFPAARPKTAPPGIAVAALRP